MQNTSLIAQVVLGLSAPAIICSLFLMRPQQAAVIAALGAELFLPEGAVFRFPSVPPLDKHNLPYVCLLIGCLLRYPGRVTKIPKERWILFLTSLVIVGSALTAWTNSDIMPREFLAPIAGLKLSDGFFQAIYNFWLTALPFYVGYALFKKPSDLRLLLVGFSIGAVIYIPFELWEMRMSPNLHAMVYGYFQDEFADTRRWGGYRPMVFMKHGLALARFMVVATLAPFVFGNKPRAILGVSWKAVRWLLTIILVLCKSTGALFYMVLALPLLIWPKAKRELRVAAIIAAIVFFYPVLRLTGIFPIGEILEGTNAVAGGQRTQSLGFRFMNEDKLLAHASERVLLGWGQYGRNFTYDRYGKPAVVDGYWIIQFGVLGVVGFIATFGLILVPIVLGARRLPLIAEEDDRRLVAGSSLILSIIAADLLPNGLWGLYPYFMAGVLAGVTRELTLSRPVRAEIVWQPDGQAP